VLARIEMPSVAPDARGVVASSRRECDKDLAHLLNAIRSRLPSRITRSFARRPSILDSDSDAE
jgi:hypothetical protein